MLFSLLSFCFTATLLPHPRTLAQTLDPLCPQTQDTTAKQDKTRQDKMKAATVMMIMVAVMAVGTLAERGETGDEREVEGQNSRSFEVLARRQFRTPFDVQASTGRAPRSSPSKIAVCGSSYYSYVASMLQASLPGVTGSCPSLSPLLFSSSSIPFFILQSTESRTNKRAVDSYSVPPTTASALSAYQTILLLRTPGNTELANWVKNGGRLITEWNAAQWSVLSSPSPSRMF